ncbi:origin recognition complex subunit 5 [Mytilus galloprovincialis]|uniref:Origin recognition complex subunit 5 n=1 Tax=Mytilus galloprovincialis TaxID=29158 RepID=A0A8B6FAG2_MYTGA|nr:origin recognition complex subunit 5 [Mytilus galloprovincialis]
MTDIQAASENMAEVDNFKEDLNKTFPCRQSQINLLLSLFGQRHQYTYSSLFIYGHTGTGKTAVTTNILNHFKLPHVLVNCVECYSSRFLYEMILNSLHGNSVTESSDLVKCDNMNDFVRMFKQVSQEKGINQETIYIVLDKAERLREMEMNILPAFLRLQELTQQNVCVILLSEIVWEKFRTGSGYCEPFVLHFSDYTNDQLIEIMMLDHPTEYDENFYRMYLNLVLSVFQMVCRNLKELHHLAKLNFQRYAEPVKTGEATAEDTRKLWKNIEPHLKKALQTVYLREVSSSQWEKMQQSIEAGQPPALQGLSSRSHVELPYYSKFLLIAAYLASYNPAKTDKRFFAKHGGKTSRQSKLLKKHERASNHMLGPKPFALDRMMAIFYAVVEGRVAPTANIFMQISSLVSLNLLGHVASDDQIDSPKYKCLVSLDFIKSVSRTVNFEVMRYLFDFV